MKTLRKRYDNGVIVGFRRGEWWIGARHNFAMDALELNLFGLTLFIPLEFFWRGRNR